MDFRNRAFNCGKCTQIQKNFKIFQDFSKCFKTFSRFFKTFSRFWNKFWCICQVARGLVPERSAQVQILVYFPGRSGPSTRAVGGWWVGGWWVVGAKTMNRIYKVAEKST